MFDVLMFYLRTKNYIGLCLNVYMREQCLPQFPLYRLRQYELRCWIAEHNEKQYAIYVEH